MTALRWFTSGVSPRGTPPSRRARGRHPALLLAVGLAASVLQSGCQFPGECRTCNWSLKAFGERITRPFRHETAGCCGGATLGVESAPPLQYGTPAVIPAPSGMGTGTVIQQGPATTLPPGDLEPIPRGEIGSPPATDSTAPQGAKAGGSNSKTSYDAFRPADRKRQTQGRAGALARTQNAGPVPTNRSAQGLSSSPAAVAVADADYNLDNLPPLDVPSDVARLDVTPPAPAVVERERPGQSGPAPAAESIPAGAPVDASAAPGIRRFASVEARLSGGSVPSPDGLDWLLEKGYKTVLDLRDGSELTPAFIADVTRRGLRYIPLPITPQTVDADHLARFNAELAPADARPLYFCDTDGTRAAALWYLRKVTTDKVEPQVARQEAEEIGPIRPEFWRAAQTYLNGLKPNDPDLPPDPTPAEAPGPVTPGAPKSLESTPTNAPAPGKPSAANAPDAPTAGPAPTAQNERDPAAWKPVAALLVTGLGVPLAYLSRSALPWNVRALARASLPGAGRPPRSLPGGSDG